MSTQFKAKSPFYPGQPVPVEFFVGRSEQINRILQRGVSQVANGKPVSIFIQGEYGIGKSSIAGFVQSVAEIKQGLLGIYAPLGGVEGLSGLATSIVSATLRAGVYDPNRSEKIRNWLAKYVGQQELFGIKINLEKIKQDSVQLSTPHQMLEFLGETYNRLKDSGIKGIFLVLDEINGITSSPQFSHFIKGLVDQNALSQKPVPLLLMLCGVEEKRREMIQKHQPIDRIFDVIQIDSMNSNEMEEFFTKAFNSEKMTVTQEAMDLLTHFSAGFPKIMHLVGDCAYWLDTDGEIDKEDAFRAILTAAEEVGKKYVDQQVYKALRSEDYKSILNKIAKMGPDIMSFNRSEISSGLTEREKKKVDNFFRKMKSLKVIRPGDSKGEYIFNMRMVRLYIWMQSTQNAYIKK